jgi:2,4-dienoyl-CoA reductase-like NADH-dependent reductase (Old Yellow Enzyme family)
MHDSDPAATYGYVMREMAKRQLAFICSREAQKEGWLGHALKRQFGGVYIANEGFTGASAAAALAAGEADAVAWGKAFIANPDLPARLAKGAALNDPKPDSFYAPGPEGYVDYPLLSVA